MMLLKLPDLAMPESEKWSKSESMLNTLENTLFTYKLDLELQANKYYEKFYELIKNNMLSIETISCFEQRLLAYLVFPSLNGDDKYLINLDNCWPQIQGIILTRYDTQMIEILSNKVSDSNTSLIPNFHNIVADIEKILTASDSIRLKKARRLLQLDVDSNNQVMSWLDSIKNKSIQKQVAIFKAFEQFSKAEYASTITDKTLFLSRNSFWKFYFNNGLIKQSVLLTTSENKYRAILYSENCMLLPNDIGQKHDFGIMFYVGDTVIIEWANPDGFYMINQGNNKTPDFTEATLRDNLQHNDITKHRGNAYSYWQYRLALYLKGSVGVQPSKADYKLSKMS